MNSLNIGKQCFSLLTLPPFKGKHGHGPLQSRPAHGPCSVDPCTQTHTETRLNPVGQWKLKQTAHSYMADTLTKSINILHRDDIICQHHQEHHLFFVKTAIKFYEHLFFCIFVNVCNKTTSSSRVCDTFVPLQASEDQLDSRKWYVILQRNNRWNLALDFSLWYSTAIHLLHKKKTGKD